MGSQFTQLNVKREHQEVSPDNILYKEMDHETRFLNRLPGRNVAG